MSGPSLAAERDADCLNCGSTREACEARASWPPHCCPLCARSTGFGTHVRRGPDRAGAAPLTTRA